MSSVAKSLAVTALLSSFFAAPVFAADAPAADQTILNSKDIKWADAPPSLPKGAKLAVLHGDPGKPGPFTIRLKAPRGYKIPPHWHSEDENLTVISGALYLGMGDKMATKEAKALNPGGFHFLPGKAHHYAFTKSATVIQVNGNGPFDINYINPEDNPEKAAKK